MLSKSRGQVLRFAAALQVLFSTDSNDEDNISEAALTAAIDFVQVANRQTLIIAGRESLEEEMQNNNTGRI